LVVVLNKGVYEAARKCLAEYGEYALHTHEENSVQGGISKVDDVVMVDDTGRVLCERKSPSVMKKVGERLPPRGIKLQWAQVPTQSLVGKILCKVSALFFVNYDTGYKYM
jgi:hypothetical protein